MAARRWILLAGAALLVLLATTWWAAGPRVTNEFSVGDLGTPNIGTPDIGTPDIGTPKLTAGAGFMSGATISNSFVAHDTRNSGLAGRYSAAGSNPSASGKQEPFCAEFRVGPWSEVKSKPLERLILTGAGDPWLSYRIELQGAITPDGSQWLFRPEVTGKGPGGEFSVQTGCQFFPMSRALTVTVTERFGNERPRRYALTYDVEFDGYLRQRSL